jgi:entry exclusion lipoprotein TrbK
MKHVALVIVAAAALAACNKSPTVNAKNATPEEVAKKVQASGADQNMVEPGLWQSKVTIEKFEMPGVPPEMASRMKTMMAENQGHDFETCLTPEDVKKPKEDFFAGKNNECRYEHFTMGGGKIDALMHCGKDGGASTMRMAGTYSPDAYQMQMATEAATSDDGAGAMQMQMRVEARRVGECSAKQG